MQSNKHAVQARPLGQHFSWVYTLYTTILIIFSISLTSESEILISCSFKRICSRSVSSTLVCYVCLLPLSLKDDLVGYKGASIPLPFSQNFGDVLPVFAGIPHCYKVWGKGDYFLFWMFDFLFPWVSNLSRKYFGINYSVSISFLFFRFRCLNRSYLC